MPSTHIRLNGFQTFERTPSVFRDLMVEVKDFPIGQPRRLRVDISIFTEEPTDGFSGSLVLVGSSGVGEVC